MILRAIINTIITIRVMFVCQIPRKKNRFDIFVYGGKFFTFLHRLIRVRNHYELLVACNKLVHPLNTNVDR